MSAPSIAALVLALVLAFLSGGVAATWAWAFLVLRDIKRRQEDLQAGGPSSSPSAGRFSAP